jgi:hypothetical protein
MSLAEIEAAVKSLPFREKISLMEFLHRHLLVEQAACTPQVDLAKFSGSLRLAEDPLGWQQKVRGEWQ